MVMFTLSKFDPLFFVHTSVLGRISVDGISFITCEQTLSLISLCIVDRVVSSWENKVARTVTFFYTLLLHCLVFMVGCILLHEISNDKLNETCFENKSCSKYNIIISCFRSCTNWPTLPRVKRIFQENVIKGIFQCKLKETDYRVWNIHFYKKISVKRRYFMYFLDLRSIWHQSMETTASILKMVDTLYTKYSRWC